MTKTPKTKKPTTKKIKAPNLTKSYPRSPRELFAGYVIAGRALDKCRAEVAGTAGEYRYACGLDERFFKFTGISPEKMKEFVATGADDEAITTWIHKHAKKRSAEKIVQWNFQQRCTLISDLPLARQKFVQDYIEKNLAPEVRNKVTFFFDMLDGEEGRL